jgi:hypothetical protein
MDIIFFLNIFMLVSETNYGADVHISESGAYYDTVPAISISGCIKIRQDLRLHKKLIRRYIIKEDKFMAPAFISIITIYPL